MKKKLLSIVLIGVMAVSLIACGDKSNTSTNGSTGSKATATDTAKNETKEEANTKTVDGLTLNATAKIETVKGDRTKDNVADKNGEYFADGSNIVKASDYKNIVVDIDVKNDTDKVVNLNSLNFSGELQDGYKLKTHISLTGDKQDDQVQSKASGKCQVSYIVKNDIKTDKIKLTYLWVKNKEEFAKLIKDPNISKISEKEAKEKYKDVFTTIKLQADINK